MEKADKLKIDFFIMTRHDWIYVHLPNLLVKRLDEFIKSDHAEKMGITSKPELLRDIVIKFLQEQDSKTKK